MAKVSIKKCEKYDVDKIYSLIKESINEIGNIDEIIKKDSSVFIKLNCVAPFPKESGICSHPDVVEAVVRIVLEQTNNIIIGDNPATREITSVLKKNGIWEVVQKYNLKVIDQHNNITIKNSNPKIYSEFEVSKEMIESDLIINLPKLKTHTLTYMTCAQKNFFGLIYGLQKASWHAKASNPLQFGEAFNDLYGALLENHHGYILSILDGIIGLDGEGPSSGGHPQAANCLLTSLDCISVDTVACRIVKLNEEKIFLNHIAAQRNYGDNKNIELTGDSLDNFKDIKFSGPSHEIPGFGLRLIRKRIFRNVLLEHPVIDNKKCIKCGECAKICPPHTMQIQKGKFPNLKTKDCIRCWCCAEVCPQNAIHKSKRPLVGKIVFKK